MNYLVVPSLKFELLYVLIIINHDTRRIEHFAVTSNPNLEWVKEQIRNATPFDHEPKYLIHNNDSVFISSEFRDFLIALGIKAKRKSIHSHWRNGIAEGMNGILPQDLLNYINPLNKAHLYKLLILICIFSIEYTRTLYCHIIVYIVLLYISLISFIGS